MKLLLKLSDIDLLQIGNEYQLAGAVWAGKDRALICWLPGAEDAVGHRIAHELAIEHRKLADRFVSSPGFVDPL